MNLVYRFMKVLTLEQQLRGQQGFLWQL